MSFKIESINFKIESTKYNQGVQNKKTNGKKEQEIIKRVQNDH